MTNIKILFLMLLFSVLAGCALSPNDAARKLSDSLEKTVQRDDAVRGALMWVDAPGLGIDKGWAHGTARLEAQSLMAVDTPFLSASIGKLFVAATILALEKAGTINLDDPIVRFVTPATLSGLPVTGGDDGLSQITIRHLLSHRSGLPDYFSGKTKDGTPNVFTLLASEPDRQWSREEMLNYTREHFAAAGAPGEQFHYADTNYDLLGMVLESVEGKSFYESVRERVLDPLELDNTWYHAFEDDRAVPYADVWIEDVNLRDRTALSADQAGGGLVTTLNDLVRFVRALVEGRPVSLDTFTETMSEDAMHKGIDYGLGVFSIRPGGINFLLGQLPNLVGHSGATGAWAYYVPEFDAVIAGSVNQVAWQDHHIKFLLADVLPVLSRVAVDKR